MNSMHMGRGGAGRPPLPSSTAPSAGAAGRAGPTGGAPAPVPLGKSAVARLGGAGPDVVVHASSASAGAGAGAPSSPLAGTPPLAPLSASPCMPSLPPSPLMPGVVPLSPTTSMTSVSSMTSVKSGGSFRTLSRDNVFLPETLTYAVPPSPLQRSASATERAPFPSALTDETRHKVDDKSLEPWHYLMNIPGKNVRDQLIDSFAPWFPCPTDQLVLVKQIVGYLHSASLIVDDIEDHSDKRRGVDAAHIKFGTDKALNAANYVYFLALEKVLMLQSTQAVEAYTAEVLNLHRGQGRDIWWRVDGRVPSIAEYDGMVSDKTGGLFRLAVKLLAAVSAVHGGGGAGGAGGGGAAAGGKKRPPAGTEDSAAVPVTTFEKLFDVNEDADGASPAAKERAGLPASQLDLVTDLCNKLSIYFQIRDDIINIASPAFHEKKGFCEDVTEGKLSYCVILALDALKAAPGGAALSQELLAILREQTHDDAKKCRAVEILCTAGAVDATLRRLAELRRDSERLIKKLGGNDHLLKIVKVLAHDLEDCHDTMDRVVRRRRA